MVDKGVAVGLRRRWWRCGAVRSGVAVPLVVADGELFVPVEQHLEPPRGQLVRIDQTGIAQQEVQGGPGDWALAGSDPVAAPMSWSTSTAPTHILHGTTGDRGPVGPDRC
jgi:hypothetical protein